MKRSIKVSASFSGKIPTGNYANMSPGFFAEESFEIDNEDIEFVDQVIRDRQKELQGICYASFEAEALKAKILKIQNDRKDFRWYLAANGKQYVSVTSIINYDTDFFIDDNELRQYAAQGNLIDAQVKHFIKTGNWVAVETLEGVGADIFILKTGSLGLPLEGWDFPGFLKKYPITDMEVGVPVYNEKHEYAGTPDIICKYNGIKTMADVKRTPDKVKHFMQTAAYSKCSEGFGQLMLIPLNDKTDQGFSKPLLTTEIDRYFELFLYKRREFRKVYSI